MSWQVAIRHRTSYVYTGDVWSSYNEARVTPLTTDAQLVMEASVKVTPSAPTFRYWDYWGTMVDAFDVHEPHSELAVTGTSVVETSGRWPRGGVMSWDELARPEATDIFSELLAPTNYVPVVDELAETANSLSGKATPTEACEAAIDWVRNRLSYEKGTTNVKTTATEALNGGGGVCQDFAHVSLGLLRTMGIPARYASGYLFPSATADVGRDVAGQSHAWIEAWTGDWYALDATHGIPVGERHVLVARGRDYADVPPLRGIYRGAPAEDLTVDVELTRLG